MPPGSLLSLLVILTMVAALIEALSRRRRRKILRALAAEWRMNYSAGDRLRLAPKIARSFPIPGAAHLRVVDLIYGLEKDRYRYIFSAEFTTGVVRVKHRRVRVATYTEPRERGHTEVAGPVVLAPPEGSILDQYRRLAPGVADPRSVASLNPSPEA